MWRSELQAARLLHPAALDTCLQRAANVRLTAVSAAAAAVQQMMCTEMRAHQRLPASRAVMACQRVFVIYTFLLSAIMRLSRARSATFDPQLTILSGCQRTCAHLRLIRAVADGQCMTHCGYEGSCILSRRYADAYAYGADQGRE